MKIFEVAGEGKLHGLTVMSLDAFVKKEDDVEESQIDEIDRRGFLKGMGAAAVAGAAGSAMADRAWNKDELTQKWSGVMTAENFKGAQLEWNEEAQHLALALTYPTNFSVNNIKDKRLYFPKITSLDFTIKIGENKPFTHKGKLFTFPLRQLGDYTGNGLFLFQKDYFNTKDVSEDFINADKVLVRIEIDGNATTIVFHDNPAMIQQRQSQKAEKEKPPAQIQEPVTKPAGARDVYVKSGTKVGDIIVQNGQKLQIIKIVNPNSMPIAAWGKILESVNQGVAEGDMSGIMHAAKNYNKSFLITAELAEGGKKTFRVRAQSERVAREKFDQHHNQATIVSVKEEGITEDVGTDAKVYQNKMTGKFIAWVEINKKQFKQEGDTKEEALQNLINQVDSLKASRKDVNSTWTVIGFTAGFASLIKMNKFYAKFADKKLFVSEQPEPGYSPVSMSGNQVSPTGKFAVSDIQNAGLDISARYDIVSTGNMGEFVLKYHSDVLGTWDKDYRKKPSLTIQMAGRNLKEFALPGGNDGDSGRWYTDDELADIIGDDWFQDFDVSHDEFNIDTHGEKAKQNLASYANSWFDDKGYNVNVMGVDHNEVDHDLKWYIVGSFQNDNFADKDINEAPGDFGLGANYRAVPDDEMQDLMGRSKNKTKTKRDKFDYPYIHGSNIEVKDEAGKKFDTEKLKAAIMTRPANILGQNAKMQHSETGTEAIFDIGLPALKGLAVNEKTGEFVVVDTCPGAGACQTYCYAMKGSYVMFKAVSMGLARMLNFLLNDPAGFADKLNSEIASARSKYAKKGARIVVRWHDAGDFFSPEYMDMAYGVAKSNPDVGFYAYTKMGDVANAARPANFNMNFSQGAKSGQEKKVNITRTKHSKVVPKDMFFDLVARKGNELIKDAKGRMQFASPENLDKFKTTMATKYAIDKDSILTYDQMMKIPVGAEPKWNVIVMPGDGDNSANRNDVVGSYLLFH